MTAPSPWDNITLQQICHEVHPVASRSRNLSTHSQQLFVALHQRRWPGCLLEQEMITPRTSFLFHFFRWKGQTFNIKGETIEQTIQELARKDMFDRLGMERVLTSPTSDAIGVADTSRRDFILLANCLDRLLLDSATVAALGTPAPHRL